MKHFTHLFDDWFLFFMAVFFSVLWFYEVFWITIANKIRDL